MHHRPFAVLLLLLGAAAVSGCPTQHFPGSEVMGTFDFTAFVNPPAAGECTFVEMPTENFAFTGTFSRNPDGETFFTLNDTDRAATFDGQIATSIERAPRRFEACECPDDTRVEETLTVTLLSRSQRDALPDPLNCPPDPLNGGTPAVGGAITGPVTTPAGFDAVLACGELFDQLLLNPEVCACTECANLYRVQGVRK